MCIRKYTELHVCLADVGSQKAERRPGVFPAGVGHRQLIVGSGTYAAR